MTIDQLNQKHFDKYYVRSTSAATHEHSQVSIEYAISVLECLKSAPVGDSDERYVYEGQIHNKIKELKALLK
jgi:hypothetical protein